MARLPGAGPKAARPKAARLKAAGPKAAGPKAAGRKAAGLKVFVVPTGFHDAYVAAPSRKAALAAWGSEHDLFARGIAQQVTDPALMAEPLARPGEVIKRSRGTTEEQIAALPADVVREAPQAEEPEEGAAKSRKTSGNVSPKPARQSAPKPAPAREPAREPAPKPAPKPAKIVPKPSRAALDQAEQALEDAEDRHRRAEADFAKRQAALDRERRDAERAQVEERGELSDTVDAERERYDRAITRWRG